MVGCALDPGGELREDIVAGDCGLRMNRVQRGVTSGKCINKFKNSRNSLWWGKSRLEKVFNFRHVREYLTIEQNEWWVCSRRNVCQFFWFT